MKTIDINDACEMKTEQHVGYNLHTTTVNEDAMDKLYEFSIGLYQGHHGDPKIYHSKSHFSIYSIKGKGCIVFNEMTGFAVSTKFSTWGECVLRRKSELSRRGLRY